MSTSFQGNEVDVTVSKPTVEVSPRTETVINSSPGPAGPQGPPGPAGGETFEETWTSPVSSVVVNHNLNRYPQVVVIIGGAPVGADITYNSLNQVTVQFSAPQSNGRIECI